MKPNRKANLTDYFTLKNINPVVRFFTFSDVFLISGFGFMSPIFAIYITENIRGGGIEVVGLAQMVYLLTSSLLQVPIATLADKIKGEKDDFKLLLYGTILSAMVMLLYIFIKTPLQLYAVQFLYGLTVAMTLPTWYAIFSRHLDKNHEGYEWGVYTTLTNLGAAVTAALGGYFAVYFGFTNLFIIVSCFTLFGAICLIAVSKKMRKS